MRSSALFCLALLGLSWNLPAQEDALTGLDIVQRYVATLDVDSELAFVRMTTFTAGVANPEKRFLALSKKEISGQRSFLMRLIRPREIEGVTLLSNVSPLGEVEQYFFLPDVGKARKVTGENRSTPFLGSDFSFEDVLNEVPAAHNYTRQPDVTQEGRDFYVVRSEYKNPAGPGDYARRLLFLEKGTFNLARIEFFNTAGKMVKKLTLLDYDSPLVKGETTRPRSATMENLERGSFTLFMVVEGRINPSLESRLFTVQSIESWSTSEVDDLILDLAFEVVGETGNP